MPASDGACVCVCEVVYDKVAVVVSLWSLCCVTVHCL